MKAPATAAPSAKTGQSDRADLAVELGRALAAFGVVMIHTPLGRGSTLSDSAATCISAFFFVVPFFLSVSFYYGWLSAGKRSGKEIAAGRWRKLAGPYLGWTLIYVVARLGIYFARHDEASAGALLADPVDWLFFGHAAVHLYYVPLLAAGLTWFLFVGHLRATGPRVGVCLVGLAAALAGRRWIGESGNGFGPGSEGFDVLKSDWAPGHWLPVRLGLTWAACMVQTAPYFFGTGLVALASERLKGIRAFWPGLVGLGVVLVMMTMFRAVPLIETFAGMLLLVSLPAQRIPDRFADSARFLGLFSAGCFFGHHLVLEALQLVTKRFAPGLASATPLWAVLLLGIAATVLSYLLVVGLARAGRFGKMLSAT